MKLTKIKPGKYIVAVSGGVDSMVLLDLLSKQAALDLVVAHFNHGIRDDASEDERLVKESAQQYGLLFEVGYGHLTAESSEARARELRYKFLNSLKQKYQADAIIMAHHQDDLIETAFLNILRGTGTKGLISILTNSNVLRPLIGSNKDQIYKYAKENQLQWREDTTNNDLTYLRNYIRKQLMSKLTADQRKIIIKNIDKVAKNTKIKENLIATLSQNILTNNRIKRSSFLLLPNDLANELVISWLRAAGWRDFDRSAIIKVSLLINTATANTRHNLSKNLDLVLTKTEAKLETSP